MAYSVAQRVISKKTAFTIIVMISAENQSCCITLPSFVSGIFLPDMKRTSHFQRSRSIRGSKIVA